MIVVEVNIAERRSREGHPFSEIHYKFTVDRGPVQYDMTRLWYPVADTPFQRNHEAQQFIKRRAPTWGAQ